MQNNANVLLEKIEVLDNNPKAFINSLLSNIDLNTGIDSVEQAQDVFLLGRGYLLTGKLDVSIHLLNKALNYLVEMGDKMSLFQCYSNLGVVYREEKQFDLALKMLNKSYNLSYDLEDFSFVILALVNLASVYSSLDNIHKAHEYLEKALEYKDRLKNSKILGDLYNNYAFVLLGENKYQEALDYLLAAYEAYKCRFGDTIQTSILIVLSNIGETYVLLEDYEKARAYISRALDFAEANQIKFIESDCHLNLSKMYEAQGDYKSALFHHKRYTEINDNLSAEQIKEEIDELKLRLELESKKSEEEINILRNVSLKNKTNELEKTLKNLAHISKIGQKLTSSMDMNQIYEILRNSIYELMNVDVFGLALYDQEQEMIIYKYFEERGHSLPLMEIDVQDRVSLASHCIVNNEDLFIKSFDDEYATYLSNPYYVSIGGDKENSAKCIVYSRLISEDKCIGLITMQNYTPNEYTEADFEVIKALASYVAIAISNAQKKNIISEKAQELEYLSYNDPLTELFNRRYFNSLTEEYDDKNKFLPLGLIIGDMNYLKEINDNYGHQLGDQYLVEISRILKKNAISNPVFRLGGDEFAILVNNTSEIALKNMMIKIHNDCKDTKVGLRPLSISLGYDIKYDMNRSMDDVFALAESKMYSEKKRYKQRIR